MHVFASIILNERWGYAFGRQEAIPLSAKAEQSPCLLDMSKIVIPIDRPLKVGIAICTHASIPYVHLGLEALKRNEPETPVLIHDDSSTKQLELRLLAQSERYGASFVSTDFRKVPTIGDMSGFAEALRWGEDNALDVVVKCSRRFILNRAWSTGLAEIFQNYQYATVTGACAWYGFGFRSELVAMHVPSYIASGVYAQMKEAVRINQRVDPLPEAWYHRKAREVHRFVHPLDVNVSHSDNAHHPDCDFVVRHENSYPRSSSNDGYAHWPLMGLHRHQRVQGTVWHDSHAEGDYYLLAKEFGLPYELSDFHHIQGE